MSTGKLISHRVDGAGERALLLNGIAMSIGSWAPVVDQLAPSHEVIRCDLRGQLLSPGEPPTGLAGHARDVEALLDSLGTPSVHVLATSFGAAVGVMLAASRPQRVRSLVLIAASDGFDEEMASEVIRWRDAALTAAGSRDGGHLLDVMEPTVYSRAYLSRHAGERRQRRKQLSSLPATWYLGLARLLETAEGAMVRDSLPLVQCPTLVVAAEHDGFVPTARSRSLADGIAGARFLVLPGVGHAVVVESPDKIVELALDHWQR